MRVAELRDALGLRPLAEADTALTVSGGCTGDLLSYMMRACRAGNVWITIMNNVNVLAVASLSDAACVIIADGAEPDEEIVRKAVEQGINLYLSEETSFALCGRVWSLLNAEG